MESETANLTVPLPRGRRLRRLWPLIAVLLVAGALARAGLYRLADSSRIDPTPLPHPRNDAPYIQTPEDVARAIAEFARIEKDDLVYDLGCGDGRLVIAAAETYGCRGIGFDKNPQRVAEAQENVKRHQVEELVQIREADVFSLDLREADVVLMYLLPWIVKELVPQFEAMKPGSRIVSHDFKIEGVAHEKELLVNTAGESRQRRLFLYVTPLRHIPVKSMWKTPSR